MIEDRFNTQPPPGDTREAEPQVWRMIVKEVKYKGVADLVRARRVRTTSAGSLIEGTEDFAVALAFGQRPVGFSMFVVRDIAGGTNVFYTDAGKTYEATMKELLTIKKPTQKYVYLASVDDDFNIDWDGLRFG